MDGTGHVHPDRPGHPRPVRTVEGESSFIAIATPTIIQPELVALGAIWESGRDGLLRTDLATGAATTAVISGGIAGIRTDGTEL
ncbi:MAG: hypothetical protein ACRD0A_20580 [Acidimicrobiales bacterium]